MNKTIKQYYVTLTYQEINTVKIVNRPQIIYERKEIAVGDFRP